MASGLKRIGNLDIPQDLAFQHRSWMIQRIGWLCMGLVVLAALLGLFGRGVLSYATAADPSLPLRLEYERFARYGSLLTLRISLEPPAAPDGKLSLWLSEDYLRLVQIQRITPEPRAQHLSPTGVFYEFLLTGPVQSSDITFHVEAQTVGLLTGRMGFTDSRSLPFRHWIYP